MLRKSGQWQSVGTLSSPAYALWGNQDYVWIITKSRQVFICNKNDPGCKELDLGSGEPGTAAEPATLFSTGGSGNEFWAVDKRSVHRCNTTSCKSEPLPSVQIDSDNDRPKTLIAFLKNNSVILAGKISRTCDSPSNSCQYFVQNCSNCKAMEIAPCQLGSQIPARFENGTDSAIWAQASEKLLRFNGSQPPIVATIKHDACEFLPEAIEVGLSGLPNQFQLLVGADRRISRRDVMGNCQILTTVRRGPTLRSAWISSNGDAWVVGDEGTAFYCGFGADSCTPLSTSTIEDLIQIQWDGTKRWAFSRSGIAVPLI